MRTFVKGLHSFRSVTASARMRRDGTLGWRLQEEGRCTVSQVGALADGFDLTIPRSVALLGAGVLQHVPARLLALPALLGTLLHVRVMLVLVTLVTASLTGVRT